MGQLQHFLLIYNLRTQIVDVTSFGKDVTAATHAYAEIEAEYRDRPDSGDFEIVLLGADSLDTARVTHSRYFNGGDRLPSMADVPETPEPLRNTGS